MVFLKSQYIISKLYKFPVFLDYRSRVLSRFGNRSNELYLDNEKAGQAELDVALVLAALRQSQLQPKFDQTNPFINR